MDEEEIEKAVIAYLKKGFSQTELTFQEEQQQTKTSSSISSANSRTDPGIAKHILSFTDVKMIQLPANACLGQMVGEDHIHYCRVILGLFTQPIFVLLGIFFYPLHRIEQEMGVRELFGEELPVIFYDAYRSAIEEFSKTRFSFSPVGHYFASGSHDRTARIWSMDRIQPLRIMAGHLSDVDCVRWHANCNYIATGSSDKTVRLWDVQSRIFIGHSSMILSLAMSPDGRYMVSGDEDGTIMVWDLSSGRCVTPLVGHTACVWTLAFSCEGSLFASGSADCTVKLWDATSSMKVPKMEENKTGNTRLRSLKTLPTKSTPVYTLQFSRMNILFAAGVLSKSG